MGLLNLFKNIFNPVEPPDPKLELVADCLAQINSYKVSKDTYLGPIREILLKNFNACLKENIEVLKNKCEVCAIGSIFLTYVDKYNEVRLGDITDSCGFVERHKLVDVLSKFFSEKELDLIESAFEGPDFFYDAVYRGDITEDELDKCEEFYESYFDAKDRLRAILENVLHHGEFKP